MRTSTRCLALLIFLGVVSRGLFAAPIGYYRQPAIHDTTVVFVAEGDLWRVGIEGGSAIRLTSHPGEESRPAISPDGKLVAFVAQYEGPSEVYTMPLTGGLPTRRTYDGSGDGVAGWTRDGRILCSTRASSTLPDTQLETLDISSRDLAARRSIIPLAQAAEGTYDDDGKTLFFTRLAYQGSHTKRYKGGTAQQLWRFAKDDAEATPLTKDYLGTSRNPMWWHGRIYFLSDRDGTMNIWSMKPDGSDLRQHTHSDGWDLMSASLSDGRIVYQVGADLRLYDIGKDDDRALSITLDSDLDQTREHWVRNPVEYNSAAHIAPDGSRAVLTARGQVYVVPHRQGRLVEATHEQGVRFRDARFMPDGKHLLVLSDQSGEVEFWQAPANGVGKPEQLTTGAKVLRWEGIPSPDGKYIAHHDKNQRLYIFDMKAKSNRKIDESPVDSFSELSWSPDSKWLAYVAATPNLFRQIRLCEISTGKIVPATSTRFDSYSPAWSPDGKWLYFLSDRHLQTVVHEPWGTYQPEPFLDNRSEILLIALRKDQARSPFDPADELHPETADDSGKPEDQKTKPTTRPAQPTTGPSTRPAPATQPSPPTPESGLQEPEKSALGGANILVCREAASGGICPPHQMSPSTQPVPSTQRSSTTQSVASTQGASPQTQQAGKGKSKVPAIRIDIDGLQTRLVRAPIPPGNYSSLRVNDKSLFWLSSPTGQPHASLRGAPIVNDNLEVKTLVPDVESFELSADGKKILVQRGYEDGRGGTITSALFIIDARPDPADLGRAQLDLSRMRLEVIPREEWKSMFVDAWRMERDYFYDRNMHGVDWNAVRAKYEPLVARVTSRDELSDLLGQMISELSALHMFAAGGDMRSGQDRVMPAALGAALVRDEKEGGYRVGHIYRNDPDEPDWASPLSRFGVNVREGDVIEMIDGVPTLSSPDIAALLRQTAGRQVLLHVKPRKGKPRDVIVKPMSMGQFANLRYHEWEYTRRTKVEQASKGQIGYVHLRAMGGENFTEWAKGFYPVWNRQGLIIDVRHNRGGDIDSWIISRLLRKAWSYWSTRVSDFSTWNMQYAFRGHVVVLCDQWTASDGEAFTEAIKELKIGKVIGNRTWGGEIWLSFDNGLVDRGIASAAEMGVYGAKGSWLIEGHGVDPDMVVDNLPHATFEGKDAQLDAAIEYLQKRIKEDPVPPMPPPKYPNKSFHKPAKPAPPGPAAARSAEKSGA